MDGLISQAKAQLWEIVNELSYAKYGIQKPDLEIALYEYGNDGLEASDGFVRQVLPIKLLIPRCSLFTVPVSVGRTINKSKRFYKNSSWDLVDKSEDTNVDYSTIKRENLPKELKKWQIMN